MKRIISILLTIVLMLSLCSFSAFAEYTPAENFALALNMADAQSYVSGKTVTRAGFAEIIAGMCNLMDANKNFKLWQEYVYGTDTNNTLVTDWGNEMFEDVDPSLPQYDAIMKVCSAGYMNGMTETHFGPNYDVTMLQAVKVIITMLGYAPMAEAKGGYPDGYINAASTIKLTSGMAFAPGDYATYGQVAELIYNALDIPVYETGAIGDDYIEYVKSEETFLKACLGLTRAEGIVTDNGATSLYGASKVGKNVIVVGGESIFIENCGYAREFIGREVEAYYMETSGKKHLVYACISEYDEAITIAAEDYVSYKNGKFSYYNEKGKLESENLTKAKLIYNGAAVGSWSTSELENIAFGDITIASTTGDKYDVIIVNDYMVGQVTKKDAATEKVFTQDLFNGMAAVKTLDLSDRNEAIVTVEDAKGNALTFADVETGDIVSVLKSRNDAVLKVIVNKAKQTDFILEDYSQSDELTISSETQSFVIENHENLKDAEPLTVGASYTIYFDFMGNAVWYTTSASAAPANKGILVATDGNSSGFSDEHYVRLYTTGAKFEDYALEDRVTVNGIRKDADEAIGIIASSVADPVLYELNADETKVKAIITPLGFGEDDSEHRGWYSVTPKKELMAANITATDWQTHIKDNGYVYSASNGYLFSAKFAHSTSKTSVFSIPNDMSKFDQEKLFSVNATGFQVDTYYLVNGYSTDRLSLTPDLLVTASDAVGGVKDVKEYTAFLISKIYTAVNNDGESVTALDGIYFDYIARSSKAATYYMDEDTIFIGPKVNGTVLNLDNLPADGSQPIYTTKQPYTFNASGPAEIEAGDIIRFSTGADGIISSIRLCYDISTGNTFSSGNRSKMTGGPEVSENETVVAKPAYMRGATLKFAIGDTDPALYDDKDASFDETKFRVMTLGTGWIYVVEKLPKGITVKKATIDDIVTYEDAGEIANTVVLLSQYGNLNYGTIIYR